MIAGFTANENGMKLATDQSWPLSFAICSVTASRRVLSGIQVPSPDSLRCAAKSENHGIDASDLPILWQAGFGFAQDFQNGTAV